MQNSWGGYPHAPHTSDSTFEVDDFEEPVYRGLGGTFAVDMVEQEELEVGHEQPVYRSIGGMGESNFEDEDDNGWMPLMPPLVERQRAGVLDLGLDFDGFGP